MRRSSQKVRLDGTRGALVAVLMLLFGLVGLGSAQGQLAAPPQPLVAVASDAPRVLPPAFLGLNGASIRSDRQDWSDPALLSAVRQLHMGSIRLFGGTTANFWDWEAGQFVDPSLLPYALRRYATGQQPLPLQDLVTLVKASAATPIYDLNVVTDGLDHALALLARAAAQGLPVTRVELGNELYLEGPPNALAVSAFPTGADYGRTADAWASAIRSAFPQAEIGVVAAPVLPSDNTKATARRQAWNDGVLSAATGSDAYTLHDYFPSGLASGGSLQDPASVRDVLGSAGRAADHLRTVDLPALGGSAPVWLTEWGVGGNPEMDGSWAQGLINAAYALSTSTEPRVGLSINHALLGSNHFAALYSDVVPVQSDEDSVAAPTSGATGPLSERFGRSATGVALGLVMKAMEGASSTQLLSFPDGPQVSSALGDYPGVAAWALATPGGTRVVLLNLTDEAQAVQLPASLSVPHDLEQVAADPATLISSERDVPIVRSQADGSPLLAPYSVSLLLPVTAEPEECTASWIASGGGAWADGANWESGTPPGPADRVCLRPASGGTISAKGTVSVDGLRVGDGTVRTELRMTGAGCPANEAALTVAGNGVVAAGSSLVLTDDGCQGAASVTAPQGLTVHGDLTLGPGSTGPRSLSGDISIERDGILDVEVAGQLLQGAGSLDGVLVGQGVLTVHSAAQWLQARGSTQNGHLLVDGGELRYVGPGPGTISVRGAARVPWGPGVGQTLVAEPGCAGVTLTARGSWRARGGVVFTPGDCPGAVATLKLPPGATAVVLGEVTEEPGARSAVEGDLDVYGSIQMGAGSTLAVQGSTQLRSGSSSTFLLGQDGGVAALTSTSVDVGGALRVEPGDPPAFDVDHVAIAADVLTGRFGSVTCVSVACSALPSEHRWTLVEPSPDTPVTVRIADARAVEGTDDLVFPISLSHAAPRSVTVHVSTKPGTGAAGATSGTDFAAATSSVTFAPGEITKPFIVTVTPDSLAELNETLTVALTKPSAGLTVADASANGTIVDDDGLPAQLTVTDVPSAPEGSSAVFHLAVAGPVPGGAVVSYKTVNGTAAAGSDFAATTGTWTIPAGASSPTTDVTVPITADGTAEGGEVFSLATTVAGGPVILADGTGVAVIPANDGGTGGKAATNGPRLRIADARVSEASGSAAITVGLDSPASTTVTVKVLPKSGSGASGATANVDFSATAILVTFPAGTTSQTINVPITNDTVSEFSETFTVALSAPSGGAVLADTAGTVTINDDDGLPPQLNVADAGTVSEGSTATFAISLDSAPADPVAVTLSLSPSNLARYGPMSSTTLTFTAGGTLTQTVTVPVHNDGVSGQPATSVTVKAVSTGLVDLADSSGSATIAAN